MGSFSFPSVEVGWLVSAQRRERIVNAHYRREVRSVIDAPRYLINVFCVGFNRRLS
jgi:hypothetical protein